MSEVFTRDYGFVATKDFEAFYREVVISAREYRDFVKTLSTAYNGVSVTLRSTDVRGSVDDLPNRSERWEVEFRDRDVDGITLYHEFEYIDLYEFEDFESGEILFTTHSIEAMERAYNEYIRSNGLTGVDAPKFQETYSEVVNSRDEDPKYVLYGFLYDLYEDMIAQVESEFDDVMKSY